MSVIDPVSAPEITVLGVGNIVLRDEGFGVRVVEALQEKYEWPENVQLLDGGTLGMELLRFVSGTKKLLVIDAVAGDTPGKVYRFSGDGVSNHFNEKLSAHEIGIQDVLTVFKFGGHKMPETVVIGAVPENLDAGMELSNTLAARVPELCDMAVKELSDWGVKPQPRK